MTKRQHRRHQRAHTIKRLRERYGLSASPSAYDAMIDMISNGEFETVIDRYEDSRKLILDCGGIEILVVHDKKLNSIRTVLNIDEDADAKAYKVTQALSRRMES